MKQQLLARIDKLDALSRRDRLSLAFGLVALAVGIEMMLIEPIQTKRQRIEQSMSADTHSQLEARTQAANDIAAQLAASRTQATQLQAKLAALGLKDGLKAAQREALAAFLARSLRSQDVVLVATQGLPVEALNIAAPADEANVAVAVAAATPASGAEAPPALFRHRTELTLEGTVPALAQAIELMERELAPLRIERVRLAPRGSAVQATVVLTTINQERTWLAL